MNYDSEERKDYLLGLMEDVSRHGLHAHSPGWSLEGALESFRRLVYEMIPGEFPDSATLLAESVARGDPISINFVNEFPYEILVFDVHFPFNEKWLREGRKPPYDVDGSRDGNLENDFRHYSSPWHHTIAIDRRTQTIVMEQFPTINPGAYRHAQNGAYFD